MTNNILTSTRVEEYSHNNETFYVKREDLACLEPGPPFAKVRGLYIVMEQLKNRGIDTVGYMDTAISMASWGISFFAKELGMKAVIYYPQYKNGYRHNQSKFIPIWEGFGATVIPLEKPNLQKINENKAKTRFRKAYPEGEWLIQGLKFEVTIDEVAKEVHHALNKISPKSIVCNIGSGVMTSGILKGIRDGGYGVEKVYAVTAHRDTDVKLKKEKTLKLIKSDQSDLLEVIATKHLYEQTPKIDCPFPCNMYYDLKAYEWMIDNFDSLPKPVLFWNIGA